MPDDMVSMSFVVAVAPRTGVHFLIKNGLSVSERGENLL